MTYTHYELHGDVAVITLTSPPVNALSQPLRAALVDDIAKANEDANVRAIVLAGQGQAFSGGADITEFGTTRMIAHPTLHDVLTFVDLNDKPVVAALHGLSLGGGFELALACQYRIATFDSKFALPEVKLGLLPGAGGTQRLPRAVGLELATNMVISGEQVPAPLLGMAGAFEKLVDAGSLLEEAVALARSVADRRPMPRLRDRKVEMPDHEAFLGLMRTSTKNLAPKFPAPLKCLEALKAAVELPFDQGLAVEQQCFASLMYCPVSKSLRSFFFAERAASRIAGVPEDTPARKVESVGVIGAGTMGTGISMNFLNAGIPVTIVEMKPEALERGIQQIRSLYEGQLKKGKLKQDKLDARMALLRGALSLADLKDCDLVIEAVFEDMDVKRQVFTQLDEIVKQGAILASNTSALDLNKIAAFTKRPQDVVGLHFFSPANVMKLLEIVRGEQTAPDVLATVMKLAKKIRKVAVISGVCDGFIGNRMISQYGRAAGFLLEEGASPQQIDQALEKFGMAMGPFRMGDLAGGDVSWAQRKRKLEEDPGLQYSRLADTLYELGRFGQKTGKGWYLYEDGRTAKPDSEVDELIKAHREKLGITPRQVSDEEIVQKCILALVNEAAKLLQEGIAARASDIDLVYIYGYGFPVYRGGPMNYANELGLFNVCNTLKRFAKEPDAVVSMWEPAPLIQELAKTGGTFA